MAKHLTTEHVEFLKGLEAQGYSYPQMKIRFFAEFNRSISVSTICYRLDPDHRNRKRIYGIAKSTGIKMPKSIREIDRSWDPSDPRRVEINRQIAADAAKRGVPHLSAKWSFNAKPYVMDGPNWYDKKAGCQWISGDPSYDDSCKCRKPLFKGPYCESHDEIAHRKPAAQEAEDNDGGIAWRAPDLMSGYKKSGVSV